MNHKKSNNAAVKTSDNVSLSTLIRELNNDAMFHQLDNSSQLKTVKDIVITILTLRLEASIKGRLVDKPTDYLMSLID